MISPSLPILSFIGFRQTCFPFSVNPSFRKHPYILLFSLPAASLPLSVSLYFFSHQKRFALCILYNLSSCLSFFSCLCPYLSDLPVLSLNLYSCLCLIWSRVLAPVFVYVLFGFASHPLFLLVSCLPVLGLNLYSCFCPSRFLLLRPMLVFSLMHGFHSYLFKKLFPLYFLIFLL